MKKFLIIMLCVLFLTGCWDSRELNNLGIVSVFGIDKDYETEEIIITAQVIKPAALKKDDGSEKSPIENITAKGDTILEAVRNISLHFDRRVYFAHSKVIIISEELAQEGFLKYMDILVRNHEIRPLAWVFIAKDAKAQDILGVKHGLEEIQGLYLDQIIQRRELNSKVSAMNVSDITKRFLKNELQPIVGVMEIIESPVLLTERKENEKSITTGIKLTGTAVFKNNKLIGYLNNTETRGLNWVTGKIKSGVINVPSTASKDENTAIVITKANSQIIPEIRDGKLLFTIKVKVDGAIGEQESTTDISDLEELEKMEKEQKTVVEKEIKLTIDKVQKEFSSDILGFGSSLHKKYPKEWNKIKDNWDTIFPDVQYEVKVDSRLKRSGLLIKPLQSME